LNEPTHVDLFSGIGGFALAAQWAGFRTIAFCEIDPYCQKVLAKNFMADTERKPRTRDISELGIGLSGEREASSESRIGSRGCPRIFSDIFDLDGTQFRRNGSSVTLVTGGFPCQPFSVAGKRRGAADDRHLWPEMLRVIKEARPAWVLGENVPGIIPMELDNVLSDLESIGYATRPFVIPACAVDARHRRDRLWIVCRDISNGNSAGLGERRRPEPIRTELDPTQCACEDSNSENVRGIAQLGDEQNRNLQRSRCEWLPEPDVRGMVNGLPERLDQTLNGQRLDSYFGSCSLSTGEVRELWQRTIDGIASQERQSFRQLSEQFANSLSVVPHFGSLARREESVAAASAYMRSLWKACETIGTVRNPSDSLPEIWKSMSCSETDWMHMAACSGCFHSEWPETTRVAHGIPRRVDRLKGLGNAIVPQVAYEILKVIYDEIQSVRQVP
jgi:DNA (cytosine-5)-methyltransferase 1